MTVIITRSALIAHGQTPAPEVHSLVSTRPGEYQTVTWEEVLRHRRARQSRQLALKRMGRETHVYRLSVALYATPIFGGWQALLERATGESVWIDRDRRWLCAPLMTIYPFVLPMEAPPDRPSPVWERWKIAFAQHYARGRQAGKPRGVTYLWWDGTTNVRHVTAAPCPPAGQTAAAAQPTLW